MGAFLTAAFPPFTFLLGGLLPCAFLECKANSVMYTQKINIYYHLLLQQIQLFIMNKSKLAEYKMNDFQQNVF